MSQSKSETLRRLKIGATMTSIAGCFPLGFGLYFFVLFYFSLAQPAEPWRAGQFTPAPYSLEDVRACNESLGTYFVLSQHMELANLINTGTMVLIISLFGLRRRQKWAWFTLLTIFLWVGLNDAAAFIEAQLPAIPLIPEAFGLTGLFVARRAIFPKD